MHPATMEVKVMIRVLIAEGNATYRQSLLRMLQDEEGIEPLEPAGNGREAIEKCGRLRPDVVLIDLDMPDQGGLLATRAIRERWPAVRMILLSFHGGEAFRRWAGEAGAVAFLPKDADPEAIVQAIRRAASPSPPPERGARPSEG